jgi:5-methylcytosine-specific restriction protein A
VRSGSRCQAHRAQRHAEIDSRRGSSTERGYDRDWRRLRALVLLEEPLLPVMCEQGKLTPGREVDHLIPIAAGGDRLCPGNLQPLCTACHIRKTAAENGGFGGG